MRFFEFIFYFILSIYILGWLGRLWLRWFIAKKQREFSEGKNPGGFYQRTYSWGGNNATNQEKTKDGVNIKEIKQTEKKVKEKVGDYVDFEEVKD